MTGTVHHQACLKSLRGFLVRPPNASGRTPCRLLVHVSRPTTSQDSKRLQHISASGIFPGKLHLQDSRALFRRAILYCKTTYERLHIITSDGFQCRLRRLDPLVDRKEVKLQLHPKNISQPGRIRMNVPRLLPCQDVIGA